MMCREKPMGLLQCNGPLFLSLTHHTCCLLHGWATCLKWSLIGIVICGGIGGKFLEANFMWGTKSPETSATYL
jgi:hypothetical protein